jgi:hypothetical protein
MAILVDQYIRKEEAKEVLNEANVDLQKADAEISQRQAIDALTTKAMSILTESNKGN